MALGVGALKGAVTGLAGIAGGIIGSRARKTGATSCSEGI